MKADTLHSGETRDSKLGHSHEAWDPEWIDGRFACVLECPHCSGESGLTGRYTVRDERGYANGQEIGGYVKYFIPSYFTESPSLFEIPRDLPNPIRVEIERSFQLYWFDGRACANSLRIAVEELLTAQHVNKSDGRPTSGNRRRMLSLHQRIGLFAKKNSQLADKLMAIKWIGNAGSHTSIVDAHDLLDAYEILSFVLDEIYEKRSKRVGAIARAVNRRSAPRSERRT